MEAAQILILYNKYLIVTCMTRCWQWVWEEEAVEPGTEEEEAVVRLTITKSFLAS